jgi:DNA-directed RNA polymerase specialized sigma24 family protein
MDVRAAERELASRTDSPEDAFERAWSAEVLARAYERMRGERHFDAFELALSHGLGPSEVGTRLGLKPKEAENAVRRARKRFREFVLEEIRLDVETRAEAEEELARLLDRIR